MAWFTKIGPNHSITIEGVVITVDRYVKLHITCPERDAEIIVTSPQGNVKHIPSSKEPKE